MKVIVVLLMLSFASAAENAYNIVPRPAVLTPLQGHFAFTKATTIVVPQIVDKQLSQLVFLAAKAITEMFEKSAGFNYNPIELRDPVLDEAVDVVAFDLTPDIANPEGYEMSIKTKMIRIRASTPQGLFYATQTIRQLLPIEIESKEVLESFVNWEVPCAEITDQPEYPYRGLMIDVSRHFTNASMIIRYIDKLSYFKLNRLHWHLTDDQGWRIEIKQYPELTSISAWRKQDRWSNSDSNQDSKSNEEINWGEQEIDETDMEDYEVIHSPHSHHARPRNSMYKGIKRSNDIKDGKYGGFYTHEEVKQVVEYARRRFVTIVPEIEMPGHAVAVFAAYPQFSCLGAADDKAHFDVITSWGIFSDVFCMREETFTFLENVLTEVAQLFPYSELIHIGGDECPKGRWQNCKFCLERAKEEKLSTYDLQKYLVNRISKFVSQKLGRRVIGWDEIMSDGLDGDAAVMSWQGTHGGLQAARRGHDAVFSPMSHCYFDYYQARQADEPHAIGGYVPLETVFDFDPLKLVGLRKERLSSDEETIVKHIVGGQGNLWTEYMPNVNHTDYMIFPRACALAETLWSPYKQKDYVDFLSRLNPVTKRLDKMGVNYCKASLKPPPHPVVQKQESSASLSEES